MIDGISVVICCYNSEPRLPKVLEHLIKQELEREINWEVIVVDNASKDRTSEVAAELWTRADVEFRLIQEPKPGLSNARLAGFDASKYDIISFIDDDNWVEPKWIEKVFRIMDSMPDVGISGGLGAATFESEPPAWFKEYQSAFAVGSYGKETGIQDKLLINGAGMNVRRKGWDDLRSSGFDFLLSGRKGKALSSGEDVELCHAFRLSGWDLYYDADLTFFHLMPEGRLNWKYLVKLYGAFGRAAPIENFYQALFHDTGFAQLKSTNTVLSTARAFIHLIRFAPRLIPLWFKKDVEGERTIVKFAYIKNSFTQRLRLFFTFPQYVSRVKKSEWYIKGQQVLKEKAGTTP